MWLHTAFHSVPTPPQVHAYDLCVSGEGSYADLDVKLFAEENCSLGGNRSQAGAGSQLTAGRRLLSYALGSQGTGSQAITKSFSKGGPSTSEAKKDKKCSSNWIDKSNEARLRDLRAKRERNKRKNRVSSSSAVRKPNAVVKAHHNIVPRFPKPMQVR